MSIFQGKLEEYPMIAIDNFTAENLSCTAFFLSHCHSDHMEGLDSADFLERLRNNADIHLYCSEATKNLLREDKRLKPLCEFTHDIPINQPTSIKIFKENLVEKEILSVTLIPAGHCIGSVMFFFEGHAATVLYTGDFRLQIGDIQRVPCLRSGNSVKRIQGLYIDTTFCMPFMSKLPKREESRNAIVKLIGSWLQKGSNYCVYIQCSAKYGYEHILREVAMAFNTKVHLDDNKTALYSAVPGMSRHCTADASSTRIHSCSWQSMRNCNPYLPCGLSFIDGRPVKLMTIKPSTIWFTKRKYLPEDNICYDEKRGFYRVLHSMHASYEEIRDVVGYIKPQYLYPTVTPCGTDDVLDAYNNLKDLMSSDRNIAENESGIKQETSTQDKSRETMDDESFDPGIPKRSPRKALMALTRAKRYDALLINDVTAPPLPSLRRKAKKFKEESNALWDKTITSEDGSEQARSAANSEFDSETGCKESGASNAAAQWQGSPESGYSQNTGLIEGSSLYYRRDNERTNSSDDSKIYLNQGKSFGVRNRISDSHNNPTTELINNPGIFKNRNDKSDITTKPVNRFRMNDNVLQITEETAYRLDSSDIAQRPQEFDIPLSPGCKEPSEEELKKLYVSISKTDSMITS